MQVASLGARAHQPPDRPSRWPWAVLIFLGVLFLGILELVPRSQVSHRLGCERNCFQLRLALETYAHRHAGLFPARLEDLVEAGVLTCLPVCPDTGRPSYVGYRVSSQPASYRFSCQGPHGWEGPVEFDCREVRL